jgi:hypothetical protein
MAYQRALSRSKCVSIILAVEERRRGVHHVIMHIALEEQSDCH